MVVSPAERLGYVLQTCRYDSYLAKYSVVEVPSGSRKVCRERASTSHVLNILRCTTRTYTFSHFLIFICYFSYILGKEGDRRNKKEE